MNFKVNESEKKLRGSYYTPDWLADFVARWVNRDDVKTILEPSCGDGVFFDAIVKVAPSTEKIFTGFDIDPAAIETCYSKQEQWGRKVSLTNGDFLKWAISNIQSEPAEEFDAVVGNPPFVRYQYLEKDQQENAQTIFNLLEMNFTKHTNLWIPFVIASIKFLRPGGFIGMVIPSEVLHVLYAQGLREYLLTACNKVLLIDPEDLWFEDTLQGAMLLMAQKKKNANEKTGVAIVRTKGREFANEDPMHIFTSAEYTPENVLLKKWTYALLSKEELDAYARVCSSSVISPFSALADVDVGIVTGANKYFLVNDEIVDKYGLSARAHPMFGRSEHCPGIIYDDKQHQKNKTRKYPTNFLYFNGENDDVDYAEYLAIGTSQNIPSRYKCRIRKPWYKVSSVFSTSVSMLKRSNGMPRLILNRLNAYTTDTAYRITPKDGIDASVLVSSFLNSVTALSAELEGRYYGGGVLELVPSEIERLAVPYISNSGLSIDEIDTMVRSMCMHDFLAAQDRVLFAGTKDIDLNDIALLRNALFRLQLRRQRITSSEE